jgi:hypothetical protein
MAVGFPFTPLSVGLFGLMARPLVGIDPGPFGAAPGFSVPVVPAVPLTPAEGVVPVPAGDVVALVEAPAAVPVLGPVWVELGDPEVPGEAAPPPVAVWAKTGTAASAKIGMSLLNFFITQSRPEFY